ncbi:MAG: outer membrane beta-barrel protein [Akkermansiaceae bacterium]|nr:outer membrane beta-barrel protein [Akkermansiaceae bacterium]
MKKHFIAGTVMLASLGAASAQGLYDIAPNDDAQESSPIKWSAGLSGGWDDNVTPTLGNGDEVTYIDAYVGAALVSITPQTTWDVFGRVGGHYYIDAPVATGDDLIGQGRLGINWAHRVSERLRFSSRNYAAYELEPDYSYGFASDRQLEEYFHYQSDNAVGYRWSERFATYTGVTVTGVDYGTSAQANDRLTYSFYNQFRYSTSEQTIWTLDYRYGETNASGTAGDSTNHYVLLGVEHRFSPNSVIAVKAGMQMRDVNGGASSDSPFAEAAIRTRVNEQFSVRAFARYSVEDYGTSFPGGTYDTNNTLRVGVSADYVVSPDLTLHGGLNYIMTDMEDGRGAVAPTADTDLLNLYLGFSYKVNDGVYVTGSYNWTDSDSDIIGRTYERNRASLGVRVEF